MRIFGHDSPAHVHNIILQVLVEMGIIGLIGVLLFILFIIYKLLRKYISIERKKEKIIISILIINIFAYLLSQQFDLLIAHPSFGRNIILMFFLLGYIHNIIRKKIFI